MHELVKITLQEKNMNLYNSTKQAQFTSIFAIVVVFTLLFLPACGLISDPDDPNNNNNRPITLECRYDQSITLSDHNSTGVDYIVPCQVEIYGGTFTIEPGTIIEFEEGTGFTVGIDGIIKIKGSASDRVILRGDDPGRPSWRGLNITTNQGLNSIEYTDIIDAGDGQPYGVFGESTAAVSLQGRLSLKECNLTNSGGAGLYTYGTIDDTSIDNMEDVRIESCASYPIYMSLNLAENIDFESLDYIENGDNVIAFHSFHEDRLYVPMTLSKIDIPYYFEGGYDLYAGLILEA